MPAIPNASIARKYSNKLALCQVAHVELEENISQCINSSIGNGDLHTVFKDSLEYKDQYESDVFINRYEEQRSLLQHMDYEVILEQYTYESTNYDRIDITMTISWDK